VIQNKGYGVWGITLAYMHHHIGTQPSSILNSPCRANRKCWKIVAEKFGTVIGRILIFGNMDSTQCRINPMGILGRVPRGAGVLEMGRGAKF